MVWTIGTTQDHAEIATVSRLAAAARLAALLALLGLAVAWGLGQTWAPWALLLVIGLRLLVPALAAVRAARPPADGPCFAVATLREGPAQIVARAVPPEHALLSMLSSTKCAYFDYEVTVLDEATGERKVVDAAHKESDFWLKDVTGSLLVRSAGIVIDYPPQIDEDLRTHDQTPRAVGERLHKLGIDPFVSPGVRRAILLRETRLDPGDNVLVHGTVVRGEGGRLELHAGADGRLLVQRWSRPTFVPAVPSWARRNLWLGALALLAGALGLAR